MSEGPAVVAVPRLDPDELAEVLRLLAAAGEADGVQPLSERARLLLEHGGGPGSPTLVVRHDGLILGVAQLDADRGANGAEVELAVDPAGRGQGIGRALLGAVTERAAGGPLHIWAHGRLPAAARLAASLGFEADRTLLRMVRPLGPHAPALPAARWPDAVRLRSFETGRDEDAWLAVNARAFTRLPDQGGWSRSDLEEREAEPWFDPAGFFLAESDGRLLGFHWTKVHAEPAEPLGEVYVIGVDPDAQGLGLGRSLLSVGIEHLQGKGLDRVMLYVDQSNDAAVRLYREFGFAVADVDVRYSDRRDARSAPRAAT